MGRSIGSRVASALAVVALIAGGIVVAAPSALADTVSSNFEGLSLGSINGQDGWSSIGGGGAPYDHAVAQNSLFANAPVSFGTQSLRISNAYVDGAFGNQTYSKKVVNEAGETSAAGDAYASGVRQASFTGQFTFIPTTTSPQTGLYTVVSPDRGDGARMSWVSIEDNGGAGLDMAFADYQDVAPFGTTITAAPNDGCDVGDDFQTTTIATGISRNAPHTVKIVANFVDGQRNDVVKVYLDGVLKHTGTSWEDYFRFCEGNPTRTVRSMLFRTGGQTGVDDVPSLAGQGFLFDGVSSTTGPIPVPVVSAGNVAVIEGNSGTTPANVPVTLSTSYPFPVTVKWATANGTAVSYYDYPTMSGTLTIPANTTSAVIPLGVYGGTTLEPNESFKVNLSSPTNATLGTSTGTITILNDELPQVTVTGPATGKLKEGVSGGFAIKLLQPYAYPLNLTVKTVNGTAVAPGDFTALNAIVAFPAQNQGPKTVFVTPKKDGKKEGAETFTVVVTGGVAGVSTGIKIPSNSS